MIEMFDLTGFQRDILYIIGGIEEPHGLAIQDQLQEAYNTDINHGRLYPNIDDLVDKGLVNKGKKDKRTNVYTLTERGEREITARREWEEEFVEELVAK